MTNIFLTRTTSLAQCRVGLIAVLLFLFAPFARGDEIIDRVRKDPNDREEDTALLELAVLANPQRVDYWEELLLALERSSSEEYLNFCYAGAALKAHPDSLALRWARLRFFSPNAALDELNELAKLEPNKERVRDARELLEIGMRLPYEWRDVHEALRDRRHLNFFTGVFLERWAVQCVLYERWETAARVTARALEFRPEDKFLKSLQALVLVQQEKYPEALAVLEKNDYLQVIGSTVRNAEYPTVGDLLLVKKQYRAAVRAFGPKPSEELINSRQGLVLAQALLEAGELERSERIFCKTDKLGANLLVIGNLLELKRVDEALLVAEELMAKWPTFKVNDDDEQEPCRALDMNQRGNWPVSLEPKLRRAVTWLYETYPQREDYLRESLVEPTELFKHSKSAPLVLSASSQLALLDQGKKLPGRDAFRSTPAEVRIRLLRDQRNDAAVAEELRRDLLQPIISHRRVRLDLGQARFWTTHRRRVEAIDYYADHFPELVRARQLLAQLKRNMWKHPQGKYLPPLNDEQISEEIVRMNPAVRALLIDVLEPNTIHGRDRTSIVRLFEKHGTEQDFPVLLSALKVVSRGRDQIGSLPEANMQMHLKNDAASAVALHRALEKITGIKNTAETPADRVIFWEAWWQTNLVRVLVEADH